VSSILWKLAQNRELVSDNTRLSTESVLLQYFHVRESIGVLITETSRPTMTGNVDGI
jgi:hypothetical protein